MGGSTMGFDLRTRVGWCNLRTTFRFKAYRKPSLRTITTHTLVPMWCAVIGHDIYDSNDVSGGQPEGACKRCQHYVNG